MSQPGNCNYGNTTCLCVLLVCPFSSRLDFARFSSLAHIMLSTLSCPSSVQCKVEELCKVCVWRHICLINADNDEQSPNCHGPTESRYVASFEAVAQAEDHLPCYANINPKFLLTLDAWLAMLDPCGKLDYLLPTLDDLCDSLVNLMVACYGDTRVDSLALIEKMCTRLNIHRIGHKRILQK